MRRVAPFVVLTGCFSTVAVRAPEGERPHVAPGAFPHELFDAVVKRVVNDRGRVDYKSLAQDRRDLMRYLAAVAEVSPHTHPELFPAEADRLAYWINAYNAYVLYAITERPMMRSVADDTTGFFYFTRYRFGSEEYSLYNLENEVIRKEFNEPRIHFALNTACAGDPELPPEAFMPDRIEAQLAREAREFCAHPDKVRVNGDEVELSQIFEWNEDDFAAAGGAIELCRKWGRTDLPPSDRANVSIIPFDWSLNAQTGRALFE